MVKLQDLSLCFPVLLLESCTTDRGKVGSNHDQAATVKQQCIPLSIQCLWPSASYRHKGTKTTSIVACPHPHVWYHLMVFQVPGININTACLSVSFSQLGKSVFQRNSQACERIFFKGKFSLRNLSGMDCLEVCFMVVPCSPYSHVLSNGLDGGPE